MRPKLSICIPTYNRARFLEETIASIISQATEEVEIVISDNASSDDTAEIVKKYRAIFPSITYYRHSENVGADRNYLKVVELANGEYCWLFGSDDLMRGGALGEVLQEISSGLDVYLCGFTLCSRDMVPIAEHHIWKTQERSIFDLSNPEERRRYFELGMTTTALFSFLGSIVVRKEKWDKVTIEQSFIGSLWVHVVKCFGIMPYGLKLKILPESFLLKRGDNDSFLIHGKVNRIGISIDGYFAVGRFFFGEHSPEMFHIRRVLKYEWPFVEYLSLRQGMQRDNFSDRERLDVVFTRCFSGFEVLDHMARVIYRYPYLRMLYLTIYQIGRSVKKWIYERH